MRQGLTKSKIIYREKLENTKSLPIKVGRRSPSKRVIGYGFTYGMIYSLLKGSSNSTLGGDDPFQVVRKINNNAYDIDLTSNYNMSHTFNVGDISPFNIGFTNSWSNSLHEGEDDEFMTHHC